MQRKLQWRRSCFHAPRVVNIHWGRDDDDQFTSYEKFSCFFLTTFFLNIFSFAEIVTRKILVQTPPSFLWSQDLVRIFSSSLMSYPKMANQKTSVGERILVHPNKTNKNKDTPLMSEKRMRRIGVSTTLSDLRFLFWRLHFMHLAPIWPPCLEKASLFGGPIDLQKIEVIWAPGNCFGQKFFRSSVRLEATLYIWGHLYSRLVNLYRGLMIRAWLKPMGFP